MNRRQTKIAKWTPLLGPHWAERLATATRLQPLQILCALVIPATVFTFVRDGFDPSEVPFWIVLVSAAIVVFAVADRPLRRLQRALGDRLQGTVAGVGVNPSLRTMDAYSKWLLEHELDVEDVRMALLAD